MDSNVMEIPGTAQIRKIGSYMSSMELLELSAKLAMMGLDKKLWSVLSRVYEDKKSFNYEIEDSFIQDAHKYVDVIVSSSVPAELKIQTFTSFRLPKDFIPNIDTVKELIVSADKIC